MIFCYFCHCYHASYFGPYKTIFGLCFFFLLSQRQMIIQDKLVKELNDAKNAVEEYVYDLRDKLCGIYEKYITEEVSGAFLHTVPS